MEGEQATLPVDFVYWLHLGCHRFHSYDAGCELHPVTPTIRPIHSGSIIHCYPDFVLSSYGAEVSTTNSRYDSTLSGVSLYKINHPPPETRLSFF